MNELFKVFLSLSLSGSLIILALFLCKHFWKDKLSRQWQYYIWLVVIARLLLPFSLESDLLGNLSRISSHAPLQKEQPVMQDTNAGMNTDVDIDTGVDVDTSVDMDTGVDLGMKPDLDMGMDAGVKTDMEANPDAVSTTASDAHDVFFSRMKQAEQRAFSSAVKNHIWLIWLAVAFGLLIRKITIYQSFVRYIKAGQTFLSDTELLDQLSVLANQAGVKKPVELCVNPLIASPLLIGFFHPCIVLPDSGITKEDFRYTALHELTHYRRMDMFYKWLVQITVCLHWYNPLVLLMSREIEKACEFSCDEAIIAKLDDNDIPKYGKTLLNAMAKSGNYKESLATVTFNENKKLLKERLGAIMKFKKKSKLAATCSVMATAAILCIASFSGVYAAAPNDVVQNSITDNGISVQAEDGVVINLSNPKDQTCLIHSSSFQAKDGQVLTLNVKSDIKGTVDFFLFSPSYQEQRITFQGNDDTVTVNLSEGTWAYNCTGFFDSGTISIVGTIE